jgi:peptide/nickel transport system substrate-binding protein
MIEIGRRSLLLAGTAAAAMSLLPGNKARAATPARGGHLRIGLQGGSSQDTADPSKVLYDAAYLLQATCRSTLVQIEADGSLTPSLAEKWEPSDDLTKWIFRIRSGVSFHSGKPLEMADVVASINLHRGKDSTSPAKSLVEPIVDISADGNSVTITLNAPNVDFPNALADYRLAVVPVKDGKADRATFDGTGAYVLKTFEPGQRMEFVRERRLLRLGRSAHYRR